MCYGKPYPQRRAEEEALQASRGLNKYRNDYLNLRKTMREYFRDTGVDPGPEIRKLIGMKET